ncbi:MAG: choice-of-anchor L domain-containing protein [Polyangiaceae bacterium]|nr:choice-of-anchor L domain-containing protein [Polyangiaceae bacterium]
MVGGIGTSAAPAQALTITPTNSAQALVQALVSQGINVTSYTIAPGQDFSDDQGPSPPTGTYDAGPLGLPDGIVITSGTARNAEPPNDSSGMTGSSNFGGSTLCALVMDGNGGGDDGGEIPSAGSTATYDANTLTVQFWLDPGTDGIAFDWMFGSEEYPEYVGSFNDAVGVFIRSEIGGVWSPHENIALDSGGNAVTINGPFFSGPTVIVPTAQFPITEYDGSTPHITTTYPLPSGPAVMHEITIVVCDALDTSLDSGVLIGGLRACTGECDAVQYCGDSLVNGNEDCDDGNNDNGDACSNTCQGPDTDGDGLSDIREGILGTNVNDPYTDGDGLDDGDEVGPNVVVPLDANDDGEIDALDPCYPNPNSLACDQDGDGLTDPGEILVGTDPGNPDTDGDGIPDGAETGSPNFPLDSDFDGVPDALESSTADDDGDGTADQFDPTNANPCEPNIQAGPCDQDNDGLTNAEEIAAGTDPVDADSDDDGALDGQEIDPGGDADNDGIVNGLDPDSDNDTLYDGTELGLNCNHPDTDLTAGTCVADADNGATTTSPVDADTDNGGASDGAEDTNGNGQVDAGETDPSNGQGDDTNVVDSDGDGLSDDQEILLGTNPTDSDSDDDGVLDGFELNAALDSDGDGLINMLDPDSDNDGLFDGTELGLPCLLPDIDLTAGHCVADADAGLTKTNPIDPDTDDGGAADGAEDWNHNGAIDANEQNPTAGNGADDVNVTDSDSDGLSDAEEINYGSDPFDSDTDDDGVLDGDEVNPTGDFDGDGLINSADPDSDNDGIFDGTEMGQPCAIQGALNCVPDGDSGTTQTGALNPDSDNGGVKDGVEDTNGNGVVDPGETDPNNPLDDICVQSVDCALEGQVCNPTTGQCVDPICDPVTFACPDPDMCHYVGICDAASGECSYNNKPNGTPCTDDNPCTNDSCQGGACVSISKLDGESCDVDGVPGQCIAGNCLTDSNGGEGGAAGSGNGGGGSGNGGNGQGGAGEGANSQGGNDSGGNGSGANANSDTDLYTLKGNGFCTVSNVGDSSDNRALAGLVLALALAISRRKNAKSA